MPGAEAFYGDQSPNSYKGISVPGLKGIDAGIKLDAASTNATFDKYCPLESPFRLSAGWDLDTDEGGVSHLRCIWST